MEKAIEQLLTTGGPAAQQRLTTLRQASAVPRPCLDYACPEW
jgi:hypothetical protein